MRQAHVLGLAVLVLGVILSNIVVFRMAKTINAVRSGLGSIHWDVKNDHASWKVLSTYRELYGFGPLLWSFVASCCIAVVGAVLFIGG